MRKKINIQVLITGILCLTLIEMVALLKGIDGTLMSLIVGIIGLAMGLNLPNPFKSR